jgi:hypothetical protein
MHYLHVETCSVVPDGIVAITDKLHMLQNNCDTQTVDSTIENSIATQICILLQTFTNDDICFSGNEYIRVVGKQGRYLLYLNDKQTTPNFIFMLILSRLHPNKQKCTKEHQNRCTHIKTNTSKCTHDQNYTLRVFSCTGGFNSKIQRLDDGMTILLESMGDGMTDNHHIVTSIHAHTRQKHRSHNTSTSLTPVFSPGVALTVRVTRDDVCVAVIPVMPTGLQCARNALRNTGAMRYTSLPGEPVNTECTHMIVIAQSHEYTLSMLLYVGTFNLRLHKTEDIFSCSTHYTEPVALVTMSHKFNSLDSVVEHIVTEKDKTGSFTGSTRVAGMLSVTQELLRLNVIAQPVRSMGSNCKVGLYTDMHPYDVTHALRAMRLVTDNKRLANSLNRQHCGVVVQCVSSTELLCIEEVSDTTTHRSTTCNTDGMGDTHPHTDFRIHGSNTLNYAIAHQNAGITTILNRSIGLDMQEISATLYSGISFCHACAYDEYPMQVKPGFSVHLINASDFPTHCTDEVYKLLMTEAVALSSVSSVVHWSRVRHNFHVNERINYNTQAPLAIECHATTSGLVFFRRMGEKSSPGGVGDFFGAVYVVPSLVRDLCLVNDMSCNQTGETHTIVDVLCTELHTPHQPLLIHAMSSGVQLPLVVDSGTMTTNPAEEPRGSAPLSTYSHPNAHRPVHKIVQLVSQLTSQTPTSNILFLRNATETLFHINSICIHNAIHHKHDTNSLQRVSGFISSKQHEKLRKVWLHTYMIRASKLCGSSQKAEFYRIYAHLSNLAALPVNSAGYWRTIPYV